MPFLEPSDLDTVIHFLDTRLNPTKHNQPFIYQQIDLEQQFKKIESHIAWCFPLAITVWVSKASYYISLHYLQYQEKNEMALQPPAKEDDAYLKEQAEKFEIAIERNETLGSLHKKFEAKRAELLNKTSWLNNLLNQFGFHRTRISKQTLSESSSSTPERKVALTI